MECTVLSPAKLNFTLHITGVADGFHMLDSIVTTVDIFDEVRVRLRVDDKITIAMRGEGCEGLPEQQNNAYRAAKLFIERYSLCGADISVKKGIPVGAGLGGSSADAAGVLIALCKLHGKPISAAYEAADATGSDTRYMLGGGWARITGRGTQVQPLSCAFSPSFLIIVPPCGVSATQCYKAFDRSGVTDVPPAGNGVLAGYAELCGALHNALYAPAAQICPEISAAYAQAAALAGCACMTGSGSAVFAPFENAELCRSAADKYDGAYRIFAASACLPQVR